MTKWNVVNNKLSLSTQPTTTLAAQYWNLTPCSGCFASTWQLRTSKPRSIQPETNYALLPFINSTIVTFTSLSLTRDVSPEISPGKISGNFNLSGNLFKFTWKQWKGRFSCFKSAIILLVTNWAFPKHCFVINYCAARRYMHVSIEIQRVPSLSAIFNIWENFRKFPPNVKFTKSLQPYLLPWLTLKGHRPCV